MTTITTSSSGDLSIIEAKVDSELYDVLIEKLTDKDPAIGTILTKIIEDHLKQQKMWEQHSRININDFIAHFAKIIILDKNITVKGVNPQVHQKYRKYIKKKYKGQDFEYNYAVELNVAIGYFIAELNSKKPEEVHQT